MRQVDKRRYYFSTKSFGKLIDAHFAYEDEAIGKPVEWYSKNLKATWEKHFKLYNETESILEKAEDPKNFELFPLYRGLGQNDSDFIFESREDALKEYESHIERSIADRLYDL